MAYRIRAETDEQTFRVNLRPGRNVVGSDPSCEVYLVHPTVSRHHAAVVVENGTVEIEDLGSRNGTLLRSQPIARAPVAPGDVFVVGRVVLALEEVADEDLELGIGLAKGKRDEPPRTARRHDTTQIFSPLDRFAFDFLPQLLERLLSGVERERFVQQVGAALFDALAPAAAVEVIDVAGERGVLYAAEHDDVEVKSPQWIEAQGDRCQVRVLFPGKTTGAHFRPTIHIAALLISLSGGRSKQQEAAPAPRSTSRAQRPAPPSVLAEMQRIYDQAERVARGDVGILIYGESGTGKEVLARFVHAASPRAEEPLVAINCASLPRDLLEAELFGVERGVATGVEARAGRFEQADKGTIFLDEIGDMAPETQAKILRVLQEREVFRLGGHTPHPARARVIAATNQPIHQMIADGRFRDDLYHRIATWEAELPPLRRRRADIPNLAAHFLTQEAQRYQIRVPGISRAALTVLTHYRWPGNIRQLRNEIARAALFLEDGELLDTERLSPAIRGAQPRREATSLAEVLEEVERDEIDAVLAATGGDTAIAAERLKISRPTLYRRIKSLGIELPSGKS